MRKQFILGMLTAPALLLLYMGIKSLFSTAAVVTAEDLDEFKLAYNYSTQFQNKPIVAEGFLISKDGKFEPGKIDTQGKPTIVRVWATWCNICDRENPDFMKFMKANKSKYTFIAVSVDVADTIEESFGTVEKYVKDKGYGALPIVYDHTGKFARSLKLEGIPTTLFLNAEGNEIGRINGFCPWKEDLIPQFMKSVFGE
jgi:thiol-disulfide isomerase/thioredoxin